MARLGLAHVALLLAGAGAYVPLAPRSLGPHLRAAHRAAPRAVADTAVVGEDGDAAAKPKEPPLKLAPPGRLPFELPSFEAPEFDLPGAPPDALDPEVAVDSAERMAPLEPLAAPARLEPPPSTREYPPTPSTRECLAFALPALGIYVASPLMSLIDAAIVGRGSSVDLAALGPGSMVSDTSAWPLLFISIAATNLVATAHAARDEAGAARIAAGSAIIAAVCGVVIGGACFGFATPLAAAYCGRAPSAALLTPLAASYIRIRALALPAVVVAMVAQAVCIGVKDSKTPVVAIAVAAVLNLAGDLLLVRGMGMGLAGAAWATTGSQYVAVLLLLRALHKRNYLSVRALTGGAAARPAGGEADDSGAAGSPGAAEPPAPLMEPMEPLMEPLVGTVQPTAQPAAGRRARVRARLVAQRARLDAATSAYTARLDGQRARLGAAACTQRAQLGAASACLRDVLASVLGFSPFLFVMAIQMLMHNSAAATAASLGGAQAAAHTALFAVSMLCFTFGDVASTLSQTYLPAFITTDAAPAADPGSYGGSEPTEESTDAAALRDSPPRGTPEGAPLVFDLDAARPTIATLVRTTLLISSSVVAIASTIVLRFGSSLTCDAAVIAHMHRVWPLVVVSLGMHGTAIALEGLLLAKRDFASLAGTYAGVGTSVVVLFAACRRMGLGLPGVWSTYLFYMASRAVAFAWRGGLLRPRGRPAAA